VKESGKSMFGHMMMDSVLIKMNCPVYYKVTPAPDAPTHTSRDMNMSVDAPATGEATLARVLAISLQENQVISKLTDTSTAIEKLERLLKETREQLDRRLAMKQQACINIQPRLVVGLKFV